MPMKLCAVSSRICHRFSRSANALTLNCARVVDWTVLYKTQVFWCVVKLDCLSHDLPQRGVHLYMSVPDNLRYSQEVALGDTVCVPMVRVQGRD